MKYASFYMTLATLTLLAACAGKNFVRPADDQLVVGSTTMSDAISILGDNGRNRGIRDSSAGQLDTLAYVYGSALGEAVFPGITPVRALHLAFFENILVEKVFVSSFKSDSTYFSFNKARTIKPGMTRADVVAILGMPPGEHRYPLSPTMSGSGLVYKFHDSGPQVTYLTTFTVELDPQGIVLEADLQDETHPFGGTPIKSFPSKWSQLRTGMNQDEVLALLGPPPVFRHIEFVDNKVERRQSALLDPIGSAPTRALFGYDLLPLDDYGSGALCWSYAFGEVVFTGVSGTDLSIGVSGELVHWVLHLTRPNRE
jgi:hypothetical protein